MNYRTKRMPNSVTFTHQIHHPLLIKKQFLVLLTALFGICAAATEPDQTFQGWKELRIGKHYDEVKHLIYEIKNNTPTLERTIWHSYTYDSGYQIPYDSIRTNFYRVINSKGYDKYYGQNVSHTEIEFDRNQRIASVSIYFLHDYAYNVYKAFQNQMTRKYKAYPEKGEPFSSFNFETKDSLQWMFCSNYWIDSAHIYASMIRHSRSGNSVFDCVKRIKSLSVNRFNYTDETSGFGPFRLGKTRKELTHLLQKEKGFSYQLLLGEVRNKHFSPDCYHPAQALSKFRKYINADVISVDLFFDFKDVLIEIVVVTRNTAEIQSGLYNKFEQLLCDQKNKERHEKQYKQRELECHYLWAVKKVQITLESFSRNSNNKTANPDVLFLSYKLHN
jgi:hypothetical protein